MRELVLPFTCKQLKWLALIIFPIMGIYGLITGDFLFTVLGFGISIGCWISQIMVWWSDDDLPFSIRCKCG